MVIPQWVEYTLSGPGPRVAAYHISSPHSGGRALLTLTASSDKFIYPPRARGALPRTDTDFMSSCGWYAQYKFNDSHLVLKLLPDHIEFWTRSADRFRSYCPPDWLTNQIRTAQDLLGLSRQRYHLLDGGLLDTKHAAIKDTLVFWDILVRDGEHLLGTTYHSRYSPLLLSAEHGGLPGYTMPGVPDVPVAARLTDSIIIPHTYHTEPEWAHMWETVDRVNLPYPQPLLEGLVFKDGLGKLELGHREQNNGHWMVRSRVTTRRHQF